MQRKYFVLIVTTLSFVAFDLVLFSYPPISSFVSNDLHLSYTQSGLITSVFALAYAMMQVPGGYLADRFGGSRTLMVSLILLGFSPFLFVVGNSYAFALISRVLAGVACGVIFPSAVRVLSSWFRENELDLAMSVFGSGMGVAQIGASAFLPLLISGTDWSPPLIFTAVFALVVGALAVLPASWSSLGRSSIKVKVDVRGLFTRNMFALMLPNFAALAIVLGVFAWTPIFLTSNLHLSTEIAGTILASIGLTNMVGCYAGAFASRRLGKRLVIAFSMVSLSIFCFLLGTAASGLEAVIWISGVGFSAMLYFAADFALIPYASKQGVSVAGMTFGVFNTLSNIGGFVSPILLGIVLDYTGDFALCFATLGLVAIFGLVGAIILRPDHLVFNQ